MTVTVIGYLSIIVLLYAIVAKNLNVLLYAAVFFSGFSGSSVFYVEAIEFSLQPSFFFFICFFISTFFGREHKIGIGMPFIIFFAFCLVNSFLPLILNGKVVIMNQDGEYTDLTYSVSNIAHLLYLLLDLMFLNAVLVRCKTQAVCRGCIKAFKLGLWAVAFVCLYQIAAFKFGFEFDAVFRQDYFHGNVQGSRIYGPCGEASMLCYYIVAGMMFVILEKKDVTDILLAAVLFILGIYSKSSTFLIGAVIIAVYLLYRFVRYILSKRASNSGNALFWVACAVFIAVISCSFMSAAAKSLFEKLRLENFSGQDRFESFMNMSPIGLLYPLGVGFGSGRSKDLLSTWLCNIGIIGIVMFAVCILDIVFKANAKRNLKKTLPMIIVVILMLGSVPEPYNLFVWFLMAYPQFGAGARTEEAKSKSRIKAVQTPDGVKG